MHPVVKIVIQHIVSRLWHDSNFIRKVYLSVEKNKKLPSVTPPMPLEALYSKKNVIDSATNGSGGGKGGNYMIFLF